MAEDLDFNYVAGEKALQFHGDYTSRVKLLIGVIGSGKSTSAAVDLIMMAAGRVRPNKKGIRQSKFAIVRNTMPQLQKTTMQTVFEWFPPTMFGTYNETKKTYIIKLRDREITLLFCALDDEKAVRDLLSLELTGAWIDEAREIKETVVVNLLTRLKRFPSRKNYQGGNKPGDPNEEFDSLRYTTIPQLILTTNYASTEHWLYKRFVEKPVPGYTMYEQGQQDNLHNLDPQYYKNLELDLADRPDLLMTLVRGEWGVTVKGKQVYPEFDRKLHVADGPLEYDKSGLFVRGWDNTGLTPACVITHVGSTGQWMIIKDFTEEDMGIADFGEMVKLWCAQHLHGAKFRDIGDPAGRIRDSSKRSPHDYLKAIGIIVENGIQTFKVRREAVAGRLGKLINGQPALIIDPSCTRLIDGFAGGYAYPEIGASGVFRTEPAKNVYSHAQDSVQYVATILFPAIEKKRALPQSSVPTTMEGFF